MRVLICGDRNWNDYMTILYVLEETMNNALIAGDKIEAVIEGEARGADTLGRIAANELNLTVLKFPALWDEHGKAAGPIRNKQMIEEGKPNLVLAFHDDIENSKGTKNMIEQARKAGIDVCLFSHELKMRIIK